MAPKKAQKMSLNEFLGDSTLGSWADEMDSLPTAPAARSDSDARPGDRRRDDFLSSRPDRAGPPREDLPLPTEPPYTAFIGNLVFDLVETDLEEFFGAPNVKSVKIIKDRDDRPKGFGYVEFTDLDGLKAALAKSGESLAGRNIRVSVAEPPKERGGFGGGAGGFDDEKFDAPWRRDGPLPDLPSRGGPRGPRSEGLPSREPPPPTNADVVNDWRSSRPAARAPPPEESSYKRRGSGLRSPDAGPTGPADSEDTWSKGSKFKPSGPPEERSPGPRFGSLRGGPPRETDTPSPPEEDNWRRSRGPVSRNSTSPNNSTPPTPQLSRRKLELLPRSNATSAVPSPLSSPNPSHAVPASRPNPFGAARPVDVTAREAAVEEKIEKGRELVKEKVVQHSMSRTSSRTGSQRDIPMSRTSSGTTPSSPKPEPAKVSAVAANVRPSFSFASAAAGKKDASEEDKKDDVQELAEKVAEVTVTDA
ncbi:hypothetical protein QCA50_010932 [Cerrena zonata]|uniref:RRM domain-containing protein n=1 Tax=Cerrena zonata TaxID=2478898 RepID=A0AAW0FGU9_9APHY